ncbi:type II secretion system minor pseudopilin GspI [Enterobacter sp.]|uniref:type II secretion system minor pseudopilin GspI n=1 Tax=Enterobacter sp. TaxID=42895 RepID=UPI00296F89C3|nr:type II secretion system minor pseudopilin GspI [Enterobacter sp.]
MSRQQSGMTLLEVLLAIVIFASVSLTLINSLSGQIAATSKMEEQVFASWVADNVLKKQQLSAAPLAATAQGKSQMGQRSWTWTLTASASDVPGMQLLTAEVSIDNGQKMRLRRYVPAEKGAADAPTR